MPRVFLDANVLFSAAYRSQSALRRLWELPEVELITSTYAAQEARMNLSSAASRQRLEHLLKAIQVIRDVGITYALPKGVTLPPKDRPILLAAIEAKATHLLTGDVSHFGSYFGRRVEGVLILPPAEFLRRHH